jgi:hypothetical protein
MNFDTGFTCNAELYAASAFLVALAETYDAAR